MKFLFLFKNQVHKTFDDENYETDLKRGLHEFSEYLKDFNIEKFSTDIFKMFGIVKRSEKPEDNTDDLDHDDKREQKYDDKNNNVVTLLSTHFPLTSQNSWENPATDMISVTELIFCLQRDKTPPELVRVFVDCVRTHEKSIYFKNFVCLGM